MRAYAKSEWSQLESVALHNPSFEAFFGVIDPRASLYERAFDRKGAENEHYAFAETLSGSGIKVHMLDETIGIAAKKASFRRKLEGLASSAIRYSGSGSSNGKKAFDDYIHSYSADDLLLIAKLKPEARSSNGRLNFVINEPLSNLYFMRDQQITTPEGIIIGRMAKRQRSFETEITKLFFDALGIKYKTPTYGNGRLEGGDFIPCGSFALMGIGDRTNIEGVKAVMKSLHEFDEVAVVKQPKHPLMLNSFDPMVDMHLDTYFNIIGNGIAVGQLNLIKKARIEVFRNKDDLGWQIGERTDLYSYMLEKGFSVIGLSMLEQASFGSNLLCLRDKKIISVDCGTTAKKVVKAFAEMAATDKSYKLISRELKNEYSKGMYNFPSNKIIRDYGIDDIKLDLSNLTGGYGGAHCMSCIIRRH